MWLMTPQYSFIHCIGGTFPFYHLSFEFGDQLGKGFYLTPVELLKPLCILLLSNHNLFSEQFEKQK